MSLSIRNRIPGTVAGITTGAVMATVRIDISGGRELTAAVTAEAVRDLGLETGSPVHALVKATEVALATGPISGLSIRNRLPGTVSEVTAGPAMAGVRIAVEGGVELTAAITADAADELRLTAGTPVIALIKSTEVSLDAA
ncbi:molybdopterin-binding protein [Kitasatospora sp. DSM 101779]|uniref:TOBE domain-containing protein n=1 Tax=Kitasatospora sp. DSM 101779 TaxID=2853165 RepID=UPI0021D966B1|nr:TOBE domain-containing protein [Kitasatospora sp. DSM 101779]MCU7825579.1 TOBE domain-containing protein [Kitasatospora sp. DSM 101779]